ncbi:hypothetical protein MNEG_4776 [Monoraphidium neglectum]|uniref:Uncharacterized protein n=1 Tax=Monoraphidium neglectum TaxID=145388 RepID=A0A0D2JX40_9CHLO|nr:hypothetical protein MNEG_4776 [Monoraphidium neglectum]KIZ03183.1 hypothetical protein MNEG_4776 [Monoraphidium neglectum]|eukprot:XP_013902202.1 hypothetical protein MNEG_4776 [Monoraphidium neglectum]
MGIFWDMSLAEWLLACSRRARELARDPAATAPRQRHRARLFTRQGDVDQRAAEARAEGLLCGGDAAGAVAAVSDARGALLVLILYAAQAGRADLALDLSKRAGAPFISMLSPAAALRGGHPELAMRLARAPGAAVVVPGGRGLFVLFAAARCGGVPPGVLAAAAALAPEMDAPEAFPLLARACLSRSPARFGGGSEYAGEGGGGCSGALDALVGLITARQRGGLTDEQCQELMEAAVDSAVAGAHGALAEPGAAQLLASAAARTGMELALTTMAAHAALAEGWGAPLAVALCALRCELPGSAVPLLLVHAARLCAEVRSETVSPLLPAEMLRFVMGEARHAGCGAGVEALLLGRGRGAWGASGCCGGGSGGTGSGSDGEGGAGRGGAGGDAEEGGDGGGGGGGGGAGGDGGAAGGRQGGVAAGGGENDGGGGGGCAGGGDPQLGVLSAIESGTGGPEIAAAMRRQWLQRQRELVAIMAEMSPGMPRAALAVAADAGAPVGAAGLSFAEHAFYQKHELINAELVGAIAAAARSGSASALEAVLDSDMAAAARGLRRSYGGGTPLLGPDHAALVAAVVRGDAALVRLLARRRAAACGGGPRPRTLAAMRGWTLGFMPLAGRLLGGAQHDNGLSILLAALRRACWGGGARGAGGGGGGGGDGAGGSSSFHGNVLVPRALAPPEFADVVFALGRGWPEGGLLLDMVVSAALPTLQLAGDPEALAPLLCRVGRAGRLPAFACRVRSSTVGRFQQCGVSWPVSADLVAALAAWVGRARVVRDEGSEEDEESDDSTGDEDDEPQGEGEREGEGDYDYDAEEEEEEEESDYDDDEEEGEEGG